MEERGTDLRLLDFGYGTGELARRVRSCCRYIAGIELDADAARGAADVFDRCLLEDLLESLETLARLDDGGFDVVVAADVLEHLPDPGRALDLLRPLVKPGGVLLVSLPNVANVTVRLSLLFGRFAYAPRGLLDASHLRFYTRRSARDLLAAHGFSVRTAVPTAMPVELALPALGRAPLAPLVRAAALLLARLRPTLFGYQFVFEAVPA
ncbi:MAG TPA: class I SAM-dependent methyltransferase [Thermoanaerobaculia bacterium]|nr:class I SAM-dependent methyltransferase [Thermoanaerobaculia bacterium]